MELSRTRKPVRRDNAAGLREPTRCVSVAPDAAVASFQSIEAMATRRLSKIGLSLLPRPQTSIGLASRAKDEDDLFERSNLESSQDGAPSYDVRAQSADIDHEFERKVRLRNAPLRKIEDDISRISRRRKALERDLKRNAALPGIIPKSVSSLQQDQEQRARPLRTADDETSKKAGSLTEFDLAGRSFLWPCTQSSFKSPLGLDGWGASRAMQQYVSKASSLIVTQRYERAEAELRKAENAARRRVGVSDSKVLTVGSSLALTSLAQGKYAASARLSDMQAQRLEALAEESQTTRHRRRASGHMQTDREREERLNQQRHELSNQRVAMLYNKGLAEAMAGTMAGHNAALDSYTKALSIDPSSVRVLQSRAASYKALKQFREAISDLNKAQDISEKSAESIAPVDASSMIEDEDMEPPSPALDEGGNSNEAFSVAIEFVSELMHGKGHGIDAKPSADQHEREREVCQ